jgi:hypothetical protein
VPKGLDEVAQLAAAFAKTLDDLRCERSDLHDTLAHSMMAMLSEIRLLRKL